MTEQNEYRGPLAGLNVVDLGHYFAGPMAAMMLADQGANVIHVVKPEGPELRERQFRLLNRNKKLLTLDLKTPEGKSQALSLIKRADIVIENFRPGVMKRLGLDYISVKVKNPGLIYLSMPGFASTDKDRAHIQAWEGVVGAATALYTDTQMDREKLKFPPVYTLVPLRSMYAAFNGTIAVIAALLARDTHGIGTVIEVPLAEVAAQSLDHLFLWKRSAGYAFRSVAGPDLELPTALRDCVYQPGDSPEIQLDKLDKASRLSMMAGSPTTRAYRCGDGRDIHLNTFNLKHITENLLKTLGIDKQLKREGFVTEGAWVTGLNNNTCDPGGLSVEHKERLVELIGRALQSKSAAEWETLLTEAGVMAAAVRTRDEWLSLEPMLKSGVLGQLNDGKSVLTVPGRMGDLEGPEGVHINDTYCEAQPITISQAEALFGNSQPKTLSGLAPPLKKGDLLKGLKVLDMANVAAGPIGARILAELGADVIRADHPMSYMYPPFVGVAMMLNNGKRSIITDMHTRPGQKILERLVSWADVLTHNILDNTAKRLGVAHDQLKEMNPGIVSCQISAYGGTTRGGWENRPGFDWGLHAVSGQMVQYGSLDKPMIHGEGNTADVMGGFTLALTALLGVWQQRKTGYAAEGRTSLAHAINYSQLPYMIMEKGNSYWGEDQGQGAVGDYPWQRLYACKDGWIYAGAREDCAKAFAEVVTGDSEADVKVMEACFAEQDCGYWQKKLNAADIGCHRVMNADDMYDSAQVRVVDNGRADETANGSLEILRWNDHPCGTPALLSAPSCVRVGEEHSYLRIPPAPRIGEHTIDILRELSYGDTDIQELIRLKVSHEYLPVLRNKEAYLYTPET